MLCVWQASEFEGGEGVVVLLVPEQGIYRVLARAQGARPAALDAQRLKQFVVATLNTDHVLHFEFASRQGELSIGAVDAADVVEQHCAKLVEVFRSVTQRWAQKGLSAESIGLLEKLWQETLEALWSDELQKCWGGLQRNDAARAPVAEQIAEALPAGGAVGAAELAEQLSELLGSFRA